MLFQFQYGTIISRLTTLKKIIGYQLLADAKYINFLLKKSSNGKSVKMPEVRQCVLLSLFSIRQRASMAWFYNNIYNL